MLREILGAGPARGRSPKRGSKERAEYPAQSEWKCRGGVNPVTDDQMRKGIQELVRLGENPSPPNLASFDWVAMIPVILFLLQKGFDLLRHTIDDDQAPNQDCKKPA